MKKKLIIAGVIIIVIITAITVSFMKMVEKQEKELAALVYTAVDMNTVKDGTYTGIAETTLVKVTVDVTVANHKITDIAITRHDNGQGTSAEVIVDDMMEQNSCDVDVISGATTSSVVIKSAVRDALIKGIN